MTGFSTQLVRKFAIAACVLVMATAFCSAQDLTRADTDELPRIEDLEAAFAEGHPSAEELIKGDAKDWIVLNDGRVFVTEPVYPRPDTLAKLALAAKDPNKTADERKAAKSVQVFLPGGEEPEYFISVNKIKEIISHEDKMIRRVDELLEQELIRDAYEMLLIIDQRVPGWETVDIRHQKLIFREAETKVSAGDNATALILLEDLLQRNKDYPGVSKTIGTVVDQLTTAAYEAKDYRRAQHYAGRLANLNREHPVVQKWIATLQGYSNDELVKAQQATDARKFDVATELAKGAIQAWPSSIAKARPYLNRYQRLVVAVQSLPGEETGYPVESAPDRRVTELLQVNLFEPRRRDEMVYFESDFFEQWEPLDLGRRVIFTLNRSRAPWQSQVPVTATALADTFSLRLNPSSPLFDERLAAYVKAYRVISPFEFEVEFERVPLRLESVLNIPVSVDGSDGPELASARFKITNQTENEVVYRRSIPEKDGAARYHVAEIVERKYPSHERAIQALIRNEVQMIPHLHPWEVDLVRKDKRRFVVKKYRLPITHSIQFNPKSESLSREIRKALDYSIDRQTLLDTHVLRSRPGAQDPSAKYGRVVTAPYWTQCYANSPVVEQRKFDLRVGMAMVIAAKLKLSQKAKAEFVKAEEDAGRDPTPEAVNKVMADAGVLPTLKMLCAPDPTARVAAEAIVSQMKRIGLFIELLPRDSQADDWDLLYRTSRMVEPMVDLWPFLAIDREARVDSLSHLPDWLAQELVNLDNAGSFAAATEQLHLLHRHLASEGHFIPLWEVDEYMAVHKSVIGMPTEPLGVYQDIEHWTIKW